MSFDLDRFLLDNADHDEKKNDLNGYNPNIFVDEERIVSQFQCARCEFIVRDCVELPCVGDETIHGDAMNSLTYNPIWCKKCLEAYFAKHKGICPIDNKAHSNLTFKPSYFVRKQPRSSKVICIHGIKEGGMEGEFGTKSGCDWKGSLAEYDKHISKDCKFIKIECPFHVYFNCCNNKNKYIMKCDLSSMLTNDAQYLSKHFRIAVQYYTHLQRKFEDSEKKSEFEPKNSSGSTGNVDADHDSLKEIISHLSIENDTLNRNNNDLMANYNALMIRMQNKENENMVLARQVGNLDTDIVKLKFLNLQLNQKINQLNEIISQNNISNDKNIKNIEFENIALNANNNDLIEMNKNLLTENTKLKQDINKMKKENEVKTLEISKLTKKITIRKKNSENLKELETLQRNLEKIHSVCQFDLRYTKLVDRSKIDFDNKHIKIGSKTGFCYGMILPDKDNVQGYKSGEHCFRMYYKNPKGANEWLFFGIYQYGSVPKNMNTHGHKTSWGVGGGGQIRCNGDDEYDRSNMSFLYGLDENQIDMLIDFDKGILSYSIVGDAENRKCTFKKKFDTNIGYTVQAHLLWPGTKVQIAKISVDLFGKNKKLVKWPIEKY